MSETQTAERHEAPEVLEIKARHQLARMEHEREMALFDQQSIGRMPLALRLMFDDRLRERVQRAAMEMSRAQGFTPQHLLGKTEACLVVVTRAVTWNLDPYSVAMSTYQTPGGKVGYEGALVRAILEASGEIQGAIRQEWYGDWSKLPRPSFRMDKDSKVPRPAWEYWGPLEEGLGVRISATLAATGEEVSLDFDLVDAYPRNATTWPTRPKLQLLNPAIRAFARQVRPSLLMGVHLREDLSDDEPPMRDITPAEQRQEAEAAQEQAQETKRSALHVIAQRNGPPKSGAEAQAAVAEKRATRRAAAARQDAAAPGAAGGASDGQQSASRFEATIGGVEFRAPEPAAIALENLIMDSASPGKLIDEYAVVLDAMDNGLANKVLAAVANRNNELARQREAAERARLAASKERPPEPASEARPAESAEPAAEPAPGGAEDAADAGPTYELKDELGKTLGEPLSAGDFLGMLQYRIDQATPDDARRFKIHNRRELNKIIEAEAEELTDHARSLLP